MTADREAWVARTVQGGALMMLLTAGAEVTEDAFCTAVQFLAAPENQEFAQKWLAEYPATDLTAEQIARLTVLEDPS